jgi:branched-chain amino acid transport system ATP-binding protein
MSGLVLTGIGVRFGGLQALDGVSVAVDPGRVVGVVGPNGAGKTTLFNVVCGFVRPRTGRIAWRDRPLRPRPHRLAALGIARTQQGLGLFAGLTVLENVMVGAHHRTRDERRLRALALDSLRTLDIAATADRLPGTLPYPVRKWVTLARALAMGPRLLLLDEPAAGMGDDDLARLAELVRPLPERDAAGDGARCAVMLVEHHLDLVMRVCDRILVLDSGRPVAAGTPAEIGADPAVADAYLGTDPEADPAGGPA